MSVHDKLSPAEGVKRTSRHLRGTLAETQADGTARFGEDDVTLLKFHGTYQGYDRDSATERKQHGLDKAWQMMVRARIPAGRLTADQYLALDNLAGRHGNGTLRITTRQGIQFHGVLKGDLKPLIAAINHALLTTLAACGDVVRNVIAPPAPIDDAAHRRLADDARRLSRHLLPRTAAYHEIWLDGEKLAEDTPEAEPLFGATYLPRKFKIALATPADNSVDVLANDLGIIALFDGDRLTGYNLALGGGLGMTHNKPATFPRLASLTAFIEPDALIPAAEAVVRLHRDYGDRGDRRHARLKYVIHEHGTAWAKARLEGYLGHALEEPRPMPPLQVADPFGWHPQGDGRWYLGLPVSSGRIADHGPSSLRSALRSVVERHRPGIVLTPTQDIILSDIPENRKAAVEAELRGFGVTPAEDLLPVQRWAMACPALPTCGLALTEAERVRDSVIDAIAEVLRRHGLEHERLSVRITGCPNGCARSYAGDIGLVGRTPGFYQIYVGGDFAGTRLNTRLLDRVALEDIPGTLEPLFAAFATDRQPGEGFGDFCHRVGIEHLNALIASRLAA